MTINQRKLISVHLKMAKKVAVTKLFGCLQLAAVVARNSVSPSLYNFKSN